MLGGPWCPSSPRESHPRWLGGHLHPPPWILTWIRRGPCYPLFHNLTFHLPPCERCPVSVPSPPLPSLCRHRHVAVLPVLLAVASASCLSALQHTLSPWGLVRGLTKVSSCCHGHWVRSPCLLPSPSDPTTCLAPEPASLGRQA